MELGNALRSGIMLAEAEKKISDEMNKYENRLIEYRSYDNAFLYKLFDQAQKMSADKPGSGALQYFAALEILRERSREDRKNKVFSKFQAEVITLSTAILAFCALVMLLIEGIKVNA